MVFVFKLCAFFSVPRKALPQIEGHNNDKFPYIFFFFALCSYYKTKTSANFFISNFNVKKNEKKNKIEDSEFLNVCDMFIYRC